MEIQLSLPLGEPLRLRARERLPERTGMRLLADGGEDLPQEQIRKPVYLGGKPLLMAVRLSSEEPQTWAGEMITRSTSPKTRV